jgi:hypothetical protein
MRTSNGNTKKTALQLLLALFAGLLIVSLPYAWRAGALYKGKSSARRALSNFSATEQRNLNSIPASIVLQPQQLNPEMLEKVEIGGYEMRVPRPTTRADTPKSILLVRGKGVTPARKRGHS